jgi:predicted GNAT family acetyltransferase
MTSLSDFASKTVEHLVAEERFELRAGEYVCVLNYRRAPGKMVIYHTEVPPPFEGNGLAGRMTHAALQYARAEGLRVEPRCPYTAVFLRKHREYADLVTAQAE